MTRYWHRTTARWRGICQQCDFPIEPGQTIAFHKDSDPARPTLTKHVECPRDKASELYYAGRMLAALGFDERKP